MASKVPSNNPPSGFTLLEVVMFVAVLLVLLTAIMLMVDPIELLKKGRDTKRINDMSTIERAAVEYKVDYGVYPDDANTLRDSATSPSGSPATLSNATTGWINENLSGYTAYLPLDPINDATYNYKYYHTSETFEVSTRLETLFDAATSDGGNSLLHYEIGNDLTLIGP